MNNSLFETEETCRGRVFKASVQHFPTKRGFGFSVRLNEMKTLSCPGCVRCGWQYEIQNNLCADDKIIGIENCQDGKLYNIEVCNTSTDWETGIVDEWDYKVVENQI